jgi:hypothetical protein
MVKTPDPAGSWRQTLVIIRADIFDKAREHGLDISDICNQALADQLGIDYEQQQLTEAALPKPVMIAPDIPAATGVFRKNPGSEPLPPVINADDLSSVTKVLTAKRQPVRKPAVPPAATVQPVPVSAAPGTVPKQDRKTAARPETKKKEKSDAIRKFIDAKLTRTGEPDTKVGRDDMYQAFSRWCRDHKIVPVPDRKELAVSLKNKYAFIETTVAGKPSWAGVQLK